MNNTQVADAFKTLAELLEIKGDNPYRIRAYRRASDVIRTLQRPLHEMSDEEILSMPAIGKDILQKIREFQRTGRIETLERLKEQFPESLTELLRVPGIGPKTVKRLYETAGIVDLASLEQAASSGKLAGIGGLKGSTKDNILRAVRFIRSAKKRWPIGMVRPVAESILQYLSTVPGVKRCSIAGSLRRWVETVKDIDIVVSAESREEVKDAFLRLPEIQTVVVIEPARVVVTLKDSLPVKLTLVDDRSFGAALWFFTGSKKHNMQLQTLAMKRGLRINEQGVFKADGTKIAGYAEEEIYDSVGLRFIPPELREARGEIEAAATDSLPELISLEDIKGDLHIHTMYSDGHHTIEEIAAEAIKRGYQYIAVTDHSRRLSVAGGLDEQRLLEQIAEVRAFNERARNFRVFTGIEVDILNDGSLDLPAGILKRLDFVVASVHSGFRQPPEQLTGRIIRAMESADVVVIGHPTGRLMPDRAPYEIDLDAVFDAAVRTGTCLEINAFPMRLDLNDVNVVRAKQKGVRFFINTDAHIKEQMGFMQYGVAVARRAWLGREDVVNTLELKDFLQWLSMCRGRKYSD